VSQQLPFQRAHASEAVDEAVARDSAAPLALLGAAGCGVVISL